MVGFFEKNSIHIILGDLDKCRCDYDKLRAYGLDINPYNFDIDEASKKIKKLFLKHHPDKGGDPEAFIELRKLEESVLEGYFSCLEKFRVGTQMDGCDPRIQKYSIGEDLITKCEDILDKKARIKHALEFIKKAEEEEELSDNLMDAQIVGFGIFFRGKSDTKDSHYPFSKYNLIKVYEPCPPWSDFRHAYYNYLLAPGEEKDCVPPYRYYVDLKKFYEKRNLDYYFKFVPKLVTTPSTLLLSNGPSPSTLLLSNGPSPSPSPSPSPLPSYRPHNPHNPRYPRSPRSSPPSPSYNIRSPSSSRSSPWSSNDPSPSPSYNIRSPSSSHSYDPSPPSSYIPLYARSSPPSPSYNIRSPSTSPYNIRSPRSSHSYDPSAPRPPYYNGCPYIYTKGEKKGETCNIKPKGDVFYCARHKKYE